MTDFFCEHTHSSGRGYVYEVFLLTSPLDGPTYIINLTVKKFLDFDLTLQIMVLPFLLKCWTSICLQRKKVTAANFYDHPYSQVIKIAIIVGFGAFVFFTRQREPRFVATFPWDKITFSFVVFNLESTKSLI